MMISPYTYSLANAYSRKVRKEQSMQNKRISKGQIKSIKTGLNKVTGMIPDAHVYIVQGLLNLPNLQSLADLPYPQYTKLRGKMYPKWLDNEWQLSTDTRTQIADLLAAYREQEMGQLRLF